MLGASHEGGGTKLSTETDWYGHLARPTKTSARRNDQCYHENLMAKTASLAINKHDVGIGHGLDRIVPETKKVESLAMDLHDR